VYSYHPFTISSSPYEKFLTCHVRSCGAWTNRLYELAGAKEKFPDVIIDGPYGDTHQDWNKYHTSVFVAGGIGVTPFAAILKQVLTLQRFREISNIRLRRIHFVWVVPSQDQFEWFIDVMRDLEKEDQYGVFEGTNFITSAPTTDIRHLMLWLAEHKSQNTGASSPFTGLRSSTHFGRPDWKQLFTHIQASADAEAKKVGVFVCASPALAREVAKATKFCNSLPKQQTTFHLRIQNF